MPIKNTDRVLHFLPIANGAYGTGAGTNGVPVGTNTPVAIDNFRKTSTDFQSTLYKDQEDTAGTPLRLLVATTVEIGQVRTSPYPLPIYPKRWVAMHGIHK